MKKIIIIVASIVLIACLIILYPCIWGDRSDLTREMKNKVEFVDDGDTHHIQYNGVNYYLDETKLLDTPRDADISDSEYIFLGWNGLRLGYVNRYYSETDESPAYIFNIRLNEVYIREDYDYTSDAFILEGTDERVMLSDIIDGIYDFDPLHSYENMIEIALYSQSYPKLRGDLTVYTKDGVWYACGAGSTKVVLSENFVELLKETVLLNNKS